jgi:hypothetical protein
MKYRHLLAAAAAAMIMASPAFADPVGNPAAAPSATPSAAPEGGDVAAKGAVDHDGKGGHRRHFDMIKKFDKNGDGKVSQDEFVAGVTAEATERFKKLDKNGDGFITQDELDAAHAKWADKRKAWAAKKAAGGNTGGTTAPASSGASTPAGK